VALAVAGIANERKKVALFNGPATTRLFNEDCSATGFMWTFDTATSAKGTALSILREGGDSWYIIAADYAFGHQLSADIQTIVGQNGGKTLGSVRHPLGSADFASYLLQAQASKAKIVAFANILITGARDEGTIDLMRFSPDAPKGSMDFLFVQIMEYLRNEGFSHFNLGMAPLSGMSKREAAPVWDRIGSTVFAVPVGVRTGFPPASTVWSTPSCPKRRYLYSSVPKGAASQLRTRRASLSFSGSSCFFSRVIEKTPLP
jgi:hypothetical protein